MQGNWPRRRIVEPPIVKKMTKRGLTKLTDKINKINEGVYVPKASIVTADGATTWMETDKVYRVVLEAGRYMVLQYQVSDFPQLGEVPANG